LNTLQKVKLKVQNKRQNIDRLSFSAMYRLIFEEF